MVYTYSNTERCKNSGHLWYEGGVVGLVNLYGMVRNTYCMVWKHKEEISIGARTVVISDTRVVLPTQQELLFEIWPLCDLCQSPSHRHHRHHHLKELFWIKTQLIIIIIIIWKNCSESKLNWSSSSSHLKELLWIKKQKKQIDHHQYSTAVTFICSNLPTAADANLSNSNLIQHLIKPMSGFVRGWCCTFVEFKF